MDATEAHSRRGVRGGSLWVVALALAVIAALVVLSLDGKLAFHEASAAEHQPERVLGVSGDPMASAAVALVDAGAGDDELRDGQFCGGALVSSRVVLTAAHCVESLVPMNVNALVSADDLCGSLSPPTRRYEVSSIELGPEGADVAALILRGDAAARPYGFQGTTSAVPFSATAFGWGNLSDDVGPQCERKSISLTVVAEDRCDDAADEAGDAIGSEFNSCALPSAGETFNTCNGDSGGPVVIMGASGPQLIGLTDWGVDCGTNSYGGYIDVGAIAEWIADEVAAASP